MIRHNLPPRAYLDEDVFASEQALILREWICVGRETDFAERGSYCAVMFASQPIVVWRDQSGRLRAFENVCRHRMSVIAEGRGVAKYLSCPFHGWTYADDGSLRAAPKAADLIAPMNLKLPEYRIECWLGFVFVNLDEAAEPIGPRLAAVESMLAPYELHSFEYSTRGSTPAVAANWKLMLEVGLESYHFPFVHNETLAPNLSGVPNPPCGNGNWTVSVEPRARSLAPRADDPAALTDAHRSTTYTFGIFPCTVFNIDVDNIVWFTLLPNAADQTAMMFGSAARDRRAVRILGEDEPSNESDYLAWSARLGGEDNAACLRVQAGLRARGARPGPIVRQAENCLYEFQDYLTGAIPNYPTAETSH